MLSCTKSSPILSFPCPVSWAMRADVPVPQGERSIAEVAAMSVADCAEFLRGMQLDERQLPLQRHLLRQRHQLQKKHPNRWR